MAKVDTSAYKTFDQIGERLDDIIGQVRDKDTSLERSLDLFDEAIALGSKAVGMVDTTAFTPEEEARLTAGQKAGGDGADGTGADGGAASPEGPDAEAGGDVPSRQEAAEGGDA